MFLKMRIFNLIELGIEMGNIVFVRSLSGDDVEINFVFSFWLYGFVYFNFWG